MEQKLSLPYALIFIISLLIFLFSILYFKRSSSRTSTIRLPPSPPKLPILGNLHQIGFYPHHSLLSLAQKYGSLMLLHFGSVPILIVSSADAAREILKTHDLIFSNRPKSVNFEKLLYNYKDIASAPYGDYWRNMKSISVLHLLSSKRVQSFRLVRDEETNNMIEKIAKMSSCSLPVNLSEIVATYTNDVVCRVALGKKYSDRGNRFIPLLGEFVELLGAVSIGNFIPRLAWLSRLNGVYARMDRVAKELDEFLELVVDEHIRRDEQKQDLVDVLLWIKKENIFGYPIDRVSIKAIILNVFAAGTETTYTILEWVMSELLKHPTTMKKVQDEVRRISKDKYIQEEDLEKLPYLKAVIKETFRVHPPIPLLLPRESTKDVMINGYHIAAKTQVFVNAYAIGRDPLSWEQPEKFLPERFLNNNNNNNNSSIDFKGHDFELIPFGSGRRGCPAAYFAMANIEIVLANLLCVFDWELPGKAKAKAESLDMSETTGLTSHRMFPLSVIATKFGQ
ncbi:hypothetical protein ACFE04_026052 [Oxalis oulophora]